MHDNTTLKQRIHGGGPFDIARAAVDMDVGQLQDLLAKSPADLLFADLQHTPYTEPQLVSFCAAANGLGVPVMFRVRHPRLAWLISSCLDFGAGGVLLPMTEDEEDVDAAIASFYYPPLGNRSFWPQFAYRKADFPGVREYADWWNANGILAIQIETAKAVRNIWNLAKPGVDLILFGSTDLTLSLEAHPRCTLTSVEECQTQVLQATRNLNVRVGLGDLPYGHFR